MKLIDADKLPYEDIESVDGNTYMCVNAYDIEHAQPIEPCESSVKPQEPKTGHWILSGGYWRCSNCKEKALLKFDKIVVRSPEYIPVKSNFCPNCGAKMESEGKE